VQGRNDLPVRIAGLTKNFEGLLKQRPTRLLSGVSGLALPMPFSGHSALSKLDAEHAFRRRSNRALVVSKSCPRLASCLFLLSFFRPMPDFDMRAVDPLHVWRSSARSKLLEQVFLPRAAPRGSCGADPPWNP